MQVKLPEAIDLSHPEKYILTIRIHPQMYSFSLYNPVENGSYFYHTVVGDKQLSSFQNFREMYFDNEFLSLPFRKIFILNYNSSFTFIPSILFNDKDKSNYMEFLSPKTEQTLLSEPLSQLGFTIVHGIEEEAYEFMFRTFISAKYIHYTAPLITYFKSRIQLVNAGRMIVNLDKTGVDVICFSRDSLLSTTHFDCNDTKDMEYYILYTWKQMKFDQLKDFIYIAGDNGHRNKLIDVLKEYIHNLIPINITPEAHFEGIETRSVPFEQACLSLCEL
ncbi:DUF3822 family protein [Bacteroidales bacterium OttesenSCG-928-M11]|nr:DUF3822 family protein [Bacteroidales bacterium OttesenSCG-928-M11]